ncbi:MAG: response regulator [Oscillospiraceae bacterium]
MNSISDNMSNQEQAIRSFLRDYSNKPNDGKTIHDILAEARGYYDADRSYICELNDARTHFSSTYECCRENIPSETENRSSVPVEGIELLLDDLDKKGEFFISLTQGGDPDNSGLCRILKAKGIESLAAAPLIVNGSVAGFLGIDNPRRNADHLLLLSVIASACCSEIVNKRLENLNNALTERMKIIQSMSEIYTSAYYIDISNNRYTELSSVDAVHGHIGSYGDARKNLEFFCRSMMTPEFTEELLGFVDLSTLDERMKQQRIVSKQFLCTVPLFEGQTELPYWVQCSFIECGRTPDGRLSHVVFVTQTIHESKVKELEQQKRLENALCAVRKINQTLQDETEIAGALSRDYPDVVLIDLADDTAVTIKRRGRIIAEEKRVVRRSYNETWDNYISKYVVEEDKAALRSAVISEKVRQALENSDEYSCSYRVFTEEIGFHYFQASFIRFYSQQKTENQIILGFRCIDAIVEEEHRNMRIMEAQSEIIEGLGSEYYSVLLVDPETDKVTLFRAESPDGRSIAEHFDRYDNRWSNGIHSYCEENVSEVCRSEFMAKLSLERIREGGGDYSFTYEKLTEEGIIYLQARVAFVREKDGGFAAVVGTRNVDDLIKKERQQEMALRAAYDAAEAANKAKTEFLSNMSHDIRTPMNGIIGMTAIAATHLDDKERVRDSLQKISQASKHMMSLINEVLDMSKIESGKVDLFEEEFNLSNLIDNLLSMTSDQINRHHHELSVNISGVTHEEVIGDSLRIQKVFTNLMSNAVKYTPDGGKIRLSIVEKPSNIAQIGCYEFIFEDNGIGMSEEFMEQIFEPFARASDSRVNKIQGTGLGMPISRNIVRMMGGDIRVESKLDVGTRFTVTIYLKLQETREISSGRFADLNVLVADDDRLSLDSCCDILEDLGMKPDGVTTGREAVEYVTNRHNSGRDYFACIIDWKMPEMDGIATTRAIRREVGYGVPIIIISAYDWSDIEQDARAAGANAFISKPLFRSRLEKTFSALVGRDEPSEQGTPLHELSKMELSGRRVLLVEDNDLNAEIAVEILEMTGLAVERAVDGKAAVDMMTACRDGYYDLIFMDIQMPQMNGYDATRAIRAMDRSYCRNIPIVAMTANAFAEDVQAAKTVGMNEHIAKPLDMKVLKRTLNRWLK